MDQRQLARTIVLVGVSTVVLGLFLWSGLFSWFGRLPGDLRIEGERTRVYVPITSMLLVSAGLTLAIWIVRRLS